MAKYGNHALITRTLPGAEKSAQNIANLGLEPIILPAASLKATNCEINIDNIQAFLVTSSNAPRLANITPNMFEIPVFAVGDATAAACEEIGFANVISAGGDAAALAVLVADRLKAKNGALLHLRGHEVAGDVKGLLSACGFDVKAATIYETIDNPEFIEKINSVLADNSGYVLFHSPRGAQRFAKYVDWNLVKNWAAISISQTTSIAIDEPAWAQFLIAKAPNENAMLELIK